MNKSIFWDCFPFGRSHERSRESIKKKEIGRRDIGTGHHEQFAGLLSGELLDFLWGFCWVWWVKIVSILTVPTIKHLKTPLWLLKTSLNPCKPCSRDRILINFIEKNGERSEIGSRCVRIAAEAVYRQGDQTCFTFFSLIFKKEVLEIGFEREILM